MTLCLDDAFIGEWHPKYAENDEKEYKEIVSCVQQEIGSTGNIGRPTFERIIKWKTRNRSKRFLLLNEYSTLYAPAFRRCFAATPERKLDELIARDRKLPGVDARVASTVVHFMHADSMPIIDVRTVGVLHHLGYLKNRGTELRHYEEFRMAMTRILSLCPRRSLRELDRALFAYHKKNLGVNESYCG